MPLQTTEEFAERAQKIVQHRPGTTDLERLIEEIRQDERERLKDRLTIADATMIRYEAMVPYLDKSAIYFSGEMEMACKKYLTRRGT